MDDINRSLNLTGVWPPLNIIFIVIRSSKINCLRLMQKCMFSSKSASLCSRLIFAPKEYSYLFFIRRKVSIITMIFQCFHQRLWYKLIDIFLKTITVGKSEYIKWKKKLNKKTVHCLDNLFVTSLLVINCK